MIKATLDLAIQTLGPAIHVILLGGAAFGLLFGILLIVDSARVVRWNNTLNRWYSTQRATRALDGSIEVKRVVYRWHRVTGVLVFAGALFTLDALVFGFSAGALVRTFRDFGNSTVVSVLFETIRIFLIIGNVAALLAAAVLVFRPSLLKGVEALADRSFGSPRSADALDAMRYQPDEFVRARPKLVGLAVALGSLYVLISLGLLAR